MSDSTSDTSARRRRGAWWVVPLLALVGVGLLATGAMMAAGSISLQADGVRVDATVVEVEQPADGGRTPIYEYEVDDDTYRYESVGTGTRRTDVGDEAELLVDPDDPARAKVASFMGLWFAPVMFGVFGAGVLVAAVVTWVVMRIARRMGAART